jgi:fused signal recognition particle receptor
LSEGRLDLGDSRSLWQRIRDVALTDVGVLVRGIDEEAVARLERTLLEADFGVDATAALVDDLERALERGEVEHDEELRRRLGRRIREILEDARPSAGRAAGADGGAAEELARAGEGPTVALLLGVNGSGKTTTAAKLAHRHGAARGGAILAAADTFRAGAQEQLRHWAERVGARFVGGQEGADPASVAYDAVEAARAEQAGLVLVDTAGRLHTRRDLMDELEKMSRVVGRLVDGAPHERLLVVDGTSGQNVVRQARRFGETVELTGLVLTKFDSTAGGGTAVAVARELGLPVRYLGTGEGVEDLEPFDPDRYVEAVLDRA